MALEVGKFKMELLYLVAEIRKEERIHEIERRGDPTPKEMNLSQRERH
jgi:hypothetical protein